MRRLFATAALAALAVTAFLASGATAADTVRRGWTPLPRCAPCGDSPQLCVVQFESDRVGWIAGAFGVARTDDGGTSWRLATTPPPGPVLRASFHGSRGVAVGSFEGVAVSGDGGLTWKQYRPIPGTVYDVQALPDRLLAATASVLYASTDGGIVWKKQGTFAGGDTYGSRFHFADALHGTVVSAVQASVTHDGGRTWRGLTNTYYTTIRLGAFTRDATHAYSVGVSGKGPSEYVLERSTDGATFDDVTAPPGESVYRGLADIAFSGDTGYAVGWEGALLRSTDAGATWVRETPPPSYERTTFRGVAVLSADRAIAVTWGGGIVTRDMPAFTETSHPYRPIGVGLVAIGGIALIGGGVRAVVARPDLVVGALVGGGLVVGGGGGVAVSVAKDALPDVSIVAQQEQPGAGVALATGAPAPPALPTATATPAAGATPTSGPSLTSSPTVAATTAAPTSAPPSTAPTRRPTTAPPTSKPPGTFTVTPATVSQQCSPNAALPSFTITLKNGTSSTVAWTLEFVEYAGNDPWASAQVTNGALGAGQSTVVTIYPNGQAVCPGMNQTTDYHLRVRQDTQATVGGPILGTVTDHISPA